MTIINPKSISGITSITTASGADNLLTVHTNNTTERVRINNDGDVIVGSGITVSPDGDIFATGVTTATTFSGSGASLTNLPAANITGTLPAISGANLTNLPAANITGTLPAISGANLTSLPSQLSTSNMSDNRVVTSSGGVVFNGEANLTFDGSDLTLQGQYFYIKAPDGGLRYFFGETQNDKSAQLSLYDTTDTQKVRIAAGDGSSDATSFFTGGNLLVGSNSSAGSDYKLESYSSGAYNILAKSTNGNGGYHNFTGQASNGTITSYISHNGRGYFEDGVQFDSSGETLDSYEEGSFSPGFSGDSSSGSYGYSRQAGRYTKIGNVVYFQLYVTTNAVNANATGNTLVTGLPFTSTGGNDYPGTCIGYYNNWNGIVPSQALLDISNTRIYIYKNNVTSSVAHSVPTDVQIGTSIILTGHYYTAS